jgi:hypothetical protein
MTNDDRISALIDWGRFTPRQATFLTRVLLHSGVAVQRQYVQFAGIARGAVTRKFFAAMVTKRLATAYACTRANTCLYHVHNRRLYECIGEPNSRFRKRGTVVRAQQRLMVLDAVLVTPHLRWLATEREKVEHFVRRHSLPLADLPSIGFSSPTGTTQRFFADKLPIGIGPLDEITLMYPMTEPTAHLFRTFLEAHRRLLKRLTRWRVQLVGSKAFRSVEPAHRRALGDFCAPPLPLRVAEEFKWYCHARRSHDENGGQRTNVASQLLDVDPGRYERARRAFSAPFFYAAYRRWLRDGDASLHDLTSSHLHDAYRRPGGIVDVLILPHAYAHLTPIAANE